MKICKSFEEMSQALKNDGSELIKEKINTNYLYLVKNKQGKTHTYYCLSEKKIGSKAIIEEYDYEKREHVKVEWTIIELLETY